MVVSMGFILLAYSCILLSFTSAFVLFPKSSVSKYPSVCADILSTNITECNNAVSEFDANTWYSEKALNSSCTNKCRLALQSWEDNLKGSCHGVTYTDDYGKTVPISSVASQLGFNFNQTCRVDNGEYCSIVLGNLTTSANGSAGGNDCNKCAMLKLRDTAQFPYGNGPLVYSQSVYQSYTSSCHLTGYPLTMAPSSHSKTSSTATSTGFFSSLAMPTSTCSGTNYSIKKGDTCESISLSQGVATMQLLVDNNLPAYCSNFPQNGTLCIKNKCSVYTVKKGDTCGSVSDAHNITTVQLRSYNPWIDTGCYTFNRTIGSQICVNEPGQKYVAPVPSSAPSAGASTAVPVPSNAAVNTTTKCGQYYDVSSGDDCGVFTNKFGISRENFLILNPEVNGNCTNLLANTSYCVQPVGQIDSYPGAPGYTGSISSVSKIAYTSLPDATYSPMFDVDVIPLAPKTNEGCQVYVKGKDLQYDYSGLSQCEAATKFWDVSLQQLLSWNPSVNSNTKGNSTSNGDGCSFLRKYRYCMRLGDPSSESPSSGSTSPTAKPSV